MSTFPATPPAAALLYPLMQADPSAGGDAAALARWAVLGILSAVGLAIAWRAGAFRARSVAGPERLGGGVAMAAPWMSIVFAGAIVWLASQAVYGAMIAERARPAVTIPAATLPADGPTSRPQVELTTGDLAFLSTVPALLGAGVMVVGAAVSAPGLLGRLGLVPGDAARGLGYAAAGFCVAYPLVVWVLLGLERAYRAAGFEHPKRHELLERLGESPAALPTAAILVGAVVAAPLFEELLFRGGVQSLLRTWLARPAQPGWSGAAGAWGAIVLTSLLFSMIHTAWMAPAIFVLSLCIGYLYERTGNLWAAILLHAGFNAAMTAMSLAS